MNIEKFHEKLFCALLQNFMQNANNEKRFSIEIDRSKWNFN